MITELLERIFTGRISTTSRTQVKQRLKFILAHDRAAISPNILEQMRREIMAVVSKYVVLDEDTLQISLETDQRTTALIANLPIRSVREEAFQEAPVPDFELDLSPIIETENSASDRSQEVAEPANTVTDTSEIGDLL